MRENFRSSIFFPSRLSVYRWLTEFTKHFWSSEFRHSHFGMHEHASSRRRECEAMAWFLTRSNNGHATQQMDGKKIVDDNNEETKLFRLRFALCIAQRTSHSAWNELRWLWLRVCESAFRVHYMRGTHTHAHVWVKLRAEQNGCAQKIKKLRIVRKRRKLFYFPLQRH